MSLRPGDWLGPYEVLGLIGAGGMGEVYRARDTKLDRDVALKTLPDFFANDPERLARFEREAKVLASLNHPNIAQIYGLEEADGVKALALELVEGLTLADRIAQGPIPLDEALPMARQIAEALEAAHEHGVIHRDLKPANIKITPDGVVKVLDFGLAKAVEPPGELTPEMANSPTITSPATQLGVILGTAAYMAPEQAKGRPIDKRVDVWAFGAVLYEMLTGTRAFAGDDVSDTLAAVLRAEVKLDALPVATPVRARQVLTTCLQRDPKQRAHDIGDVRLALEGAFEAAAPQVTVLVGARPVWRRALPLITLVLGGLVTGVAAWSLWPSTASPLVSRFEHVLPEGQQLRNWGRPVVALSADGHHFVYNTNAGLYLRTMGELEARLMPGTELNLSNPFFSPDGEWVGYWDRAAGQLKRIAVSGGAATVICAATNPFGVSWGRDDTILFGQPEGILRVLATGGAPDLVIPAEPGEQVHGPQLLPDGESVLFSVTTATGLTRWDQAQIVVQSLRTGQRTVVLRGGSDARYLPTGHLVYALEDRLFAVAFDADRLAVQGRPVSVVEGVIRGVIPNANTATAHYGLADRGTLVYVRWSPPAMRLGTLVWVDRQGKEEAIPAPVRAYTYPRLSPDGTKVALDIRDQEDDIWVWDLTSTTLTRLTFDPGFDRAPVWTPDGDRIAFSSQQEGHPNLFWRAADGTGSVERLSESEYYQFPYSFSPDGARLVCGSGGYSTSGGYGTSDIAVVTLTGQPQTTPLVQTPFTERNGEIAPDGRWLAYESDESGQAEIHVRPFPDVDAGHWQVSTGGGTRPLWARSGEELFYLAPDGVLMCVKVEGATTFRFDTPMRLFQGPAPTQPLRTYDVSSNGQRFLMIKEGTAGESDTRPGMIVVENWFEELKAKVPTGR